MSCRRPPVSPDFLSSPACLARLNDPSPWTQRMMPAYRGMTRAFFNVDHAAGDVLGATTISVRFAPIDGREDALRRAVVDEWMPALYAAPGGAGVGLLTSAREPEMTVEQKIRGRDASARWVLLVSLHAAEGAVALLDDAGPVARLATSPLVADAQVGTYDLASVSVASRSR